MFGDQGPLTGDASLTSSHDGIDYYFASAAAKQAFEASPTSYLPQFGGFCAFGVFVGKKLDGDVRYADIVEGTQPRQEILNLPKSVTVCVELYNGFVEACNGVCWQIGSTFLLCFSTRRVTDCRSNGESS
jgi:YHS domain-containing protein